MARYSRKDYERLAEVIRQDRQQDQTDGERAVTDRIMRDLSDTFAADNPRFFRKRFAAACRQEVTP